ncbi:MAG: extracellular solute-binding protein [Clostridia bacterium]|nr:extracellular solute-binding protein [Clostridia bacterium]
MKTVRIIALALVLSLVCSCIAYAETTFPLVTEPTTLSIYARAYSSYPDMDYSKVTAMVKYKEMTGVDIEWDNVNSDVWDTQLGALIASGDKLPDVIFRGKTNTTTLEKWAKEDVIIDLRPYLEEYAPNFWKLFQEEPTIGGAIVSEGGAIYGLPQVILAPEMRTPTKLWLNKKAMEKIGKDDPKTIDEFIEVMTAIRDSDWNGNGEADEITVCASTGNMHNYFFGSFGLRTRGAHHDVVDVDPKTGELRVFALSDDFRTYLEYMKKMYSEGLIYPEIFTEGDKQASVFAASDRLTCLFNTVAPGAPADKLADWYTVNWSLKGPDGYAFHTQCRGAVHSTGNFMITTDCPEEKIGLALRWVDYFYTEEGSQLALVGVKDQDWEVKADGSLGYTEAAAALRTENMADNAYRALFGLWPNGGVPACFYSNLFGAEYGEIPAACSHALMENYAPEKIWPIISYTADEGEIVSTIGTDIKNYRDSFAAQVMTGEVELTDATWEEYKDTINKMNPDKLIEAYRSALTRTYGEGAEF